MGNNPEFGLAVMNRVIKKAGAERVSDEASDTLRTILEEIANNISSNAIDLANHAGRKTIKSDDILLAYKNTYKKWIHIKIDYFNELKQSNITVLNNKLILLMDKNSNLYVSFQLLITRWGGRAAMRSPAVIVESEYIGVRLPSPPSLILKHISWIVRLLGVSFLQCLSIS